jgi:ABC-type molybdate transport system permease subunit
MLSTVMLCHVALETTDILEECIATSIIRVRSIGELGRTLAVTANELGKTLAVTTN